MYWDGLLDVEDCSPTGSREAGSTACVLLLSVRDRWVDRDLGFGASLYERDKADVDNYRLYDWIDRTNKLEGNILDVQESREPLKYGDEAGFHDNENIFT